MFDFGANRPFKYVAEVFFFPLQFDHEPEVETQMMCVCVLMYHHQVCFVIPRSPHNKRGVLQGETDKHLDKLNKAITRSFSGPCIYLWVLKLVRTRQLVCLFGFLTRDLWNR